MARLHSKRSLHGTHYITGKVSALLHILSILFLQCICHMQTYTKDTPCSCVFLVIIRKSRASVRIASVLKSKFCVVLLIQGIVKCRAGGKIYSVFVCYRCNINLHTFMDVSYRAQGRTAISNIMFCVIKQQAYD